MASAGGTELQEKNQRMQGHKDVHSTHPVSARVSVCCVHVCVCLAGRGSRLWGVIRTGR